MTTHHSHHQLDDLRREWQIISRTTASRTACELLKAQHPPLAETRARDLGDVVELLEPRSGLSQIDRAQLAAALLAATPLDGLLARALLQTLLPGLIGVARKLDWGRGRADDPASFLADLITATYELIVEWGGQRRPYAAPDLLNAARCRMRRRLEQASEARLVSLEALVESSSLLPITIDEDPMASIQALLAEAGPDVDPVGAAALFGREVLGLSLRELADLTGVSTRRLAAAQREVARRILT